MRAIYAVRSSFQKKKFSYEKTKMKFLTSTQGLFQKFNCLDSSEINVRTVSTSDTISQTQPENCSFKYIGEKIPSKKVIFNSFLDKSNKNSKF